MPIRNEKEVSESSERSTRPRTGMRPGHLFLYAMDRVGARIWWLIVGVSLIAMLVGLDATEKKALRFEADQKRFYAWKADIKAGEERGSEIGIDALFESVPAGLGNLNALMAGGELSDLNYRRVEAAILQIKLPIYKRTLTCTPESRNYTFRLVSVKDSVGFTADLTSYKQTLTILAEFDSLVDAPADVDFFLYMEPGIDYEEFTGLPLEVTVTKGRDTVVLASSHLSITPLGTRAEHSSFYQIGIPIDRVKYGDDVSILVDVPVIEHSAKYGDQVIPFSLYDFHVWRYARGIDKLHVIVDFARQVFLERICIDRDSFTRIPCPDTDISYIRPPEFSSQVPTTLLKFEMLDPCTDVAFAFFTKPPLRGQE